MLVEEEEEEGRAAVKSRRRRLRSSRHQSDHSVCAPTSRNLRNFHIYSF